MRTGRIQELDGLRALAVAGVIAFHYTRGTALANRVTGLGWMGVDLFFVLSGYLITGILLGSRERAGYFKTFYARRTLRIFPVYYLVLAVYVIAARGWGGPQPWSYWAMHAGYMSATAEYFHYWAFSAPGFVYAGVTVLWSLSIEEQFYLLWAPAVRCIRGRWLGALLGAAVLGAPALRWALHQSYFPEYRFLPTRLDSLAWGAVLALWLPQVSARVLARVAAGAGVAWLALAVATGGDRANVTFATVGYSLAAIGFAALIGWTVVNAGGGMWLCRLLRARALVYVGTISYTVYLVHYPLLLVVGRYWTPWAGSGAMATLGRDLAGVVVSLAVAGLSWKFVESPILRLKERWAPAKGYEREPERVEIRMPEVMGSVEV